MTYEDDDIPEELREGYEEMIESLRHRSPIVPIIRWAFVGALIWALALLLFGCTSLDQATKTELVHVGDVAQAFDDAAYSGVADAAMKARNALEKKGKGSAEVGLSSRLKAHEIGGTLNVETATAAAKEYAQFLSDLQSELSHVDGAIASGNSNREEAERIRRTTDEILKRSQSFTWDDMADILGGLSKEISDGR